MQFETTLTFGEPITFYQLLHERRKSMGEFYFFDRSMAAGTVVFGLVATDPGGQTSIQPM